MDLGNRALVLTSQETTSPCDVTVKIEPEWGEGGTSIDCAPIKQEPQWGECGVSIECVPVKQEPKRGEGGRSTECAPVKQEPKWGEGDVSAAAAAEGLYAGHEVKVEVLVGPELVQQENVASAVPSWPTAKEEDLSSIEPPSEAAAATSPDSLRSPVQQHVDSEPSLSDHTIKHATNNTEIINETVSAKKIFFTCDICNKQLTRSSHLTSHMRIHTGEKPYNCDVCNKRFTNSTSFTIHMRTHTGETPYSCDMCNKLFTNLNNYTRHARIHTGEKPYSCDTCNKRFTQLSTLTRHTRTHTGEKPYKCDTCNKQFTRPSTLTKHMRLHKT